MGSFTTRTESEDGLTSSWLRLPTNRRRDRPAMPRYDQHAAFSRHVKMVRRPAIGNVRFADNAELVGARLNGNQGFLRELDPSSSYRLKSPGPAFSPRRSLTATSTMRLPTGITSPPSSSFEAIGCGMVRGTMVTW